MIRVENVFFSYQRLAILRNVSFAIGAGELWQLCGSNGSGKSTLLRIVSGLLAAESGRISGEVGEIGYLPADANGLFLKADAVSNLQYWMRFYGLGPSSHGQIMAALKSWGLAHPMLTVGKLAVEKYSTGMKRRLGLARLQLAKRKVWLLDEPLFGLDREGKEVLRATLAEHIAHGGSAMVVSHDDHLFAGVAPHTLELADGKTRVLSVTR